MLQLQVWRLNFLELGVRHCGERIQRHDVKTTIVQPLRYERPCSELPYPFFLVALESIANIVAYGLTLERFATHAS